MKRALESGASIASVAESLKVDVSTLSQHTELYAQLRDRDQALQKQENEDAQRTAVAQAEAVVLEGIRLGRRPTLQSAAQVTGDPWYPAQLRAVALHALRIRLGASNLRPLTKMFNVGPDFLGKIDDVAARLLGLVERRQLDLFA
jgi:hypothetical protein